MGAAEFRAVLRGLLNRRGMSVPALARRCAYSRQYAWEVSTGRQPVTVEVARAFDDALGAAGSLVATVTSDGAPGHEGGGMRRRTVLVGVSAVAGGGLVDVAGVLFRPDAAGVPVPVPVGDLKAVVGAARADFAAVRFRQLADRLPSLISGVEAARAEAPSG